MLFVELWRGFVLHCGEHLSLPNWINSNLGRYLDSDPFCKRLTSLLNLCNLHRHVVAQDWCNCVDGSLLRFHK